MSIRSFKSTAFSPISPNRTRLTGYEYHAFPVSSCHINIVQSPSDLTIDQDGNATFSALATGSFPIQYQWQVSVDEINWIFLSNDATYSGVTSDTLLITAAPYTLNGYSYRVLVSSEVCEGHSDFAVLTVIPCFEIEITSQPSNETVGGGGSTSFSVSATGSDPIYQWQVSINAGVDWDNLVDDSTYDGVNTDTLDILVAEEGMDQYEYRCVVSNDCSSETSGSAVLTVSAPEVEADILIVGGGGGGGGGVLVSGYKLSGGGGGAGERLKLLDQVIAIQSYSVVVGTAGAGAPIGGVGSDGLPSSFNGNTAIGGGGGGTRQVSGGLPGLPGGSGGGGGGGDNNSPAGGAGIGIYGRGFSGGAGTDNSDPQNNNVGGGGGGAASIGGDGIATPGSTGIGGAGGDGISDPIVSGLTCCGGGGGGGFTAGAAGFGGGGLGGSNSSQNGSNATTPGSGGGGSFHGTGGNGYNGTVIIRYPGAAVFTGGVITTDSGDTIHTFSSSGNLDPVSSEVTVDMLIVGGGGGGGSLTGGGGGGGEVNYQTGVTLNTGTSYPVTVGAAGAAGAHTGPTYQGGDGGDSEFDASISGGPIISAAGGGGGGSSAPGLEDGKNGGGGGGGGSYNGIGGNGGDGSDGGAGNLAAEQTGGGGGGAGGPSEDGQPTSGGRGANGTLNSISGSSLCYGAGGGGGGTNTAGASGGNGGACPGGDCGSGGNGNPNGTPLGATNFGGGGGGGTDLAGPGGSGTAGYGGCVIIRYPGAAVFSGGAITTDAGDTIHTFSSDGNLDPL